MDILQSTLAWSLLLAGILAFAESALGVGVLLPGEVAITALAATLEDTQRLLAILAIALGATAGDHMGYLLGRHFGTRLPKSRLVERIGPDKWTAATSLIQRHGAPAVFVSRLLPFVRTVMPAVAGVAGLRYARFASASIAGSLVWATIWVSAGGVLNAIGSLQNPIALGILVGLSTAIILAGAVRRHRTANRKNGSPRAAMTSRRFERADDRLLGPWCAQPHRTDALSAHPTDQAMTRGATRAHVNTSSVSRVMT